MQCPQCGAENPDGSGFCSLCHHRFGAPPAPPGVPAAPPETAPAQPASVAPGPPPGVPQLPATALGPPPGAHQVVSPSEPGYGGAFHQPPPPGQLKPAKTINPFLMWAIRVVVIVVCFALGWFAMDAFLNRTRTFSNANAKISFSYPGKWKTVDTSGMTVGTFGSGSPFTWEVILADGTSEATSNHMIYVASAFSLQEWDKFKANIQNNAAATFAKVLPQGGTVTTPTFADVTVAGKPGLSVRFSASYQGTTYDCDYTFVQNGSTMYMIFYQGRQGKSSSKTFEDLLKTVKLKS
jgi:hypothetical protein